MWSAVRCDQQPEKTPPCSQTLQHQTAPYIPREKRVCRKADPEINCHLRRTCQLQYISIHVLWTHFTIQFIHLIHVFLLILWWLVAIAILLPYKMSFSSRGTNKLPSSKAQKGPTIVFDSTTFVKLRAEPNSRSRIKSNPKKKQENHIKKRRLQNNKISTQPSLQSLLLHIYISTYMPFSIIISIFASHLLSRSSPFL